MYLVIKAFVKGLALLRKQENWQTKQKKGLKSDFILDLWTQWDCSATSIYQVQKRLKSLVNLLQSSGQLHITITESNLLQNVIVMPVWLGPEE